MDLKEVDLNLLVVFNQLLIERRVSKAADALGVSQPAVSNALARLRRLLGDELFLPTSRGMQPTPFASQLIEPVTYALGILHAAINLRTAFDPAKSQRSFKIGMTDIGEIYFLPPLMEELRRVAPGVTVNTVRNQAINLKDEMEAGHVDLALGFLPALKSGFFQRRLFRHRYVCMFRKGHPLAKHKVSLAEFSASDHVVVISEGTGHGEVDQLLDRMGVKRNVRLTVPHFVAVGHILQATNLIATVPERFAQRVVEPFGLTYVTHPASLPQIAINVFWHARFHKDPAIQWLRAVIFQLFGGKS